MTQYLIKRFLLMIPTFFGATLLVFGILSLVPGGPLEKAISQIEAAAREGGLAGTGTEMISAETLEELRRQYGLDQPFFKRYLIWLGMYPREIKTKTITFGEPFRESIRRVSEGNQVFLVQKWIRPEKENGQVVLYQSGVGGNYAFGKYPELPNASEIMKWKKTTHWTVAEEKAAENKVRLVQRGFSGIFTGDLGESYVFGESVWDLIKARFHISIYFGLLGFLITYIVCIPLGIVKAVRHRSKFDFVTSFLIFAGYATPGYALGVLLLVLFGGGSFWDVFPLGGFRSPNWEELSFLGKVWDQIHHTVLPVISYMVTSFATLTILMKNSLMENLGQDYVRTAFAKGLPERKVIYVHALRNSLIPIATRLGGIIGLFLAGSYLIELVFNIDGIGLLGFNAIVNMDFPVFLGFLVLNIVVLLVGNVISDVLYVLIDPRIKFD